MKTDETRQVEETLRAAFERVDAYRYNSASIRIRIIDRRFEGLSHEQRDNLVEPHLDKLPESTQLDIINLLLLAPSEIVGFTFQSLPNLEFENPSPSQL
jgi:hypothetical protein